MADVRSASISFPHWALKIHDVHEKLEDYFGPESGWPNEFDMEILDGIVSFTDGDLTCLDCPCFPEVQLCLQAHNVAYDIWYDAYTDFHGVHFPEQTVAFRPELKKVAVFSGAPDPKIKDLKEYRKPYSKSKQPKQAAR